MQNNNQIRSQFYTYSATGTLSWHVQMQDITGLIQSKLEQKKITKKTNHELMNISEMVPGNHGIGYAG